MGSFSPGNGDAFYLVIVCIIKEEVAVAVVVSMVVISGGTLWSRNHP